MSDNRKILIAELTARSGCESDVKKVLTDYARHVRQEPGCEVFECYSTQENPHRIMVYEIYKDEAAFQAHLGAPENAEVNKKLAAITEGGSSLTFLNAFG